GEWLESLNADMSTKAAPAETKRQADAGIEVIRLPEAEAKKFLQLSLDAGWAGVIATSPQHGPKLRQLMAP
ncbi:MAG: ABC transporter substrate-binding protein, partial [Betaproteobacteria bacterium]|nr:ABC transporter substrate-binding protein [Betaproteobacteria bacterium]